VAWPWHHLHGTGLVTFAPGASGHHVCWGKTVTRNGYARCPAAVVRDFLKISRCEGAVRSNARTPFASGAQAQKIRMATKAK
jgi:hypothetical protein